MGSSFAKLGLCVALVAGATGCANREYLGGGTLLDVRRRDPQFNDLRVFPNATFIATYSRQLGADVGVSQTQGTVEEGYRGQRVEIPVRRGLPGVIVALESHQQSAVLWVSFDERCQAKDCAFGFVQTDDGLFRLFQVPRIEGYSTPFVYRKRITPRRAMDKAAIYSNEAGTPVYMTMRGLPLTIALEVKRHENIEVETIKSAPRGVKPGHTPTSSTSVEASVGTSNSTTAP